MKSRIPTADNAAVCITVFYHSDSCRGLDMVVGNQPSDRVSIVDGSQTYFPALYPRKRRTGGWWLVVA